MSNIQLLSGEATRERFFAFIIDNMFASLLGFVVMASLKEHGHAVAISAGIAAYLAYFLVFEMLFGATPGKFGFGLRVRTLGGERCSSVQIVTRTLLRLIDADPIVLGALPGGLAVLASPHRQRLGDMLAGTVVISTARLHEAPSLEPESVPQPAPSASDLTGPVVVQDIQVKP